MQHLNHKKMNYQERKDLLSEKRKLLNHLKNYNNAEDCHCLMAELLVKSILRIEEKLNKYS